jgi:transcriptional regulator with XRE-family HTH domain
MDYMLLNKLVSESKLGKAQISEMANISRTTLDNALNGADIRISTIESLSNVLGVSPGVFFDTGRPINNTATANGDSSIAAINSSVTTERNEVLKERLELMEELLAEKERLITVLMDRK